MDDITTFWLTHRKKCMTMDYEKYATRWLHLITENKYFIMELFQLFEDDTRFSSHLKLFQTPDPHQSVRLNKLSIIRKQIIKDISSKLSGRTMTDCLNLFLKRILKGITKMDIERLDSLIDEWEKIKVSNESLEAIKFQQDRLQLQRLKAFRFKGTELKIELFPQEEYKDDEIPEESKTETNLVQPEAIQPHDSNYDFSNLGPALPGTPRASVIEKTNPLSGSYSHNAALGAPPPLSISTGQFGRYPPPPTRKPETMHFYPNKQQDEKEQKDNLITSDQFISLHDRLLIYTSTGNTSIPPYLVNKPVIEWNNDDVIKFYQNEMKGSRAVIEEKYHSGILNILKKGAIDGTKLEKSHQAIQDFADQIFSFDVVEDVINLFHENNIKKELVLTELLKIIQLHMMKKVVQDIIPKFEVAKKIQRLRITYYEQGGRDHLPVYDSINIFDQTYKEYESILSKWKFFNYRWKKMISDLRMRYKLLSYYTVQDMRFICQEACNYRLFANSTNKNPDAQSCLQKLNAKFSFVKKSSTIKQTRNIVKKWTDLDGTIYLSELREFILRQLFGNKVDKKASSVFPMDESFQYAILRARINMYLELEAFQNHHNNTSEQSTLHSIEDAITKQLQLMKNDWNLKDTLQLLYNITPYNEIMIFEQLGIHLAKEFTHIINESSAVAKHTSVTFRQPHLYVVDEEDLILSIVMKCFSDHSVDILQASQILFCCSKTSLEEVTCFLYRCCCYKKTANKQLYCLIKPENLKPEITREILNSLLTLIDKDASLIIITASTTNRWYSDLRIYQQQTPVITDTECREFYSKYIGSFDRHRIDFKPGVKIFVSSESAVGKSFEIKEEAHKQNLVLIHIPFNSPTVDKDFVVHRLTRPEVQRAQQKHQQIVFHLNVSSHAGKDINTLMFQLLILRHITKSTGESFAARPNHAFFIELPSQISKTYKKTNIDDVCNYFYFVAGRRSFIPQRKIKMDLLRFEFTKQHQFVLQYLDAIDNDVLEIKGGGHKNWKYDEHENIKFDRAIQLVQKYSNFDEETDAKSQQK
eukprot:230723_1